MIADKKFKIGILTASVSRSAGGLFWAISSLCTAMNKSQSIRVFGSLDENTHSDLSTWNGVPVTASPVIGPRFFSYQPNLLDALKGFDPDILHAHGLWMYPSVASQLFTRGKKPYLISPHGMLDPWAVRNSGWKKKLAGMVYENRHLRGANCIHALCQSEYESIRAYGLTNPVAIIPNGVDLPDLHTPCSPPQWRKNIPADARVLFFLSRIHPKKGLENLLQAWTVATNNGAVLNRPWHLVIAGWDQGGHQQELEQMAVRLGISSTVHFVGPQFDHAKHASFMSADAFVLPSFSEGLPMAVLEAWSYRLPVLITPQCNIPEGFDAGAAIHIEPEKDSIASGLTRLFSMNDVELNQMANNGLALVQQQFTWDKVADQMLDVYQWVLIGDNKPDTIRALP